MEFKQNLIRLFKLLKHTTINSLFKKQPLFEDSLTKELYNKGYYVTNVEDKDFNELSKIIKEKIKKYFPNKTGDTRLYGIDEESSLIKEYFHKIILNEKKRIKEVSTIKKLYLHCTMGGYLEYQKGASSGGGWHRDHHFELFKVMLYLTDVTIDNGPFTYLEKSHSKLSQFLCLLLKFFSKETTRYSNNLVKMIKFFLRYKQKIFIAKKGTCIVFNSSGLHRGLKIKSGDRLALTAYIFSYTEDKNVLDKRSSHMKMPSNLVRKQIDQYLTL